MDRDETNGARCRKKGLNKKVSKEIEGKQEVKSENKGRNVEADGFRICKSMQEARSEHKRRRAQAEGPWKSPR